MQRDKRGRFVKKATNGMAASLNNPSGAAVQPTLNFGTKKIRYNFKDGLIVDELGNVLTAMDVSDTMKYQRDNTLQVSPNFLGNSYSSRFNKYIPSAEDIISKAHSELSQTTPKEEEEVVKKVPSFGMNLKNSINKIGKGIANGISSIDKTKLADFIELTRAGITASVNNKIADRALEAEKPFLQDVTESHRSVYGDYRSKIQGEKAAAQLRSLASKPLTSDGAVQQKMMMDAQIKGQEYVDQGNAKDDAMRRQTQEVAWQQEKENQQQRMAVAMQNKQAMFMSEKNKAQIENMRDSANFSQVVSPLLSAGEQRLRNKGAEQEYYQDHYNDALVQNEVYATFRDGLTDSQKAMVDTYQTQGRTGLEKYLADNKLTQNDWLQTQRILNNEVIRRKAALKGVTINPTSLNTTVNPYSYWEPTPMNFKKGGTVYKAKLTKRTKDNDRASRYISTSKKIAARFLEKAMDSLYTYDQVELIAKPKKSKRKYQAGGGLPFVGFTPVFATSEGGANTHTPTVKKDKESKNADLTTKDILELLKDIDGLPSDINAIQTLMSDFVISDKMDPLGLDSSSSIAARYMSLIGKIKIAKSNKEWYDKAYERLRSNNALNELAVDSRGSFIGMNREGDFARFTAQQIASGDVGDYQMLTNSELLNIRANTALAPFDANIIMEAANGIGMDQVTDHINKVIQSLGSDKSQTQVFGDQSKEVLAGLRQLQHAAQEVGQDLSISQLYEASVFTESQAQQATLALNYLYKTLPTNMQALLFAKAGSAEGAQQLIKSLVDSKLSKTTKLEFSPKNKPGSSSSSTKKTGNILADGLKLSPAQMLQRGFGERESILIQDKSSGEIHVEAITMPVTNKGGDPVGATTLEGVATSQYGGLLDFSNASMGGKTIPFEGRRNIAVDGSKIYSMYLPIDQDEFIKGNIVPDIALIDKVNTINRQIKEKQITDANVINQMYVDAGLPVYLNGDGTVVPQYYRRFGVLNGTALDNAFGKDFVGSDYLKEIDDEDIINGALDIMNYGRSKEDRIEYDAKNFFNFGGLLGEYDSVYQGTIFIPMSNDIFLGIAGSGNTITSTDANNLEAKQQQQRHVSATYVNPGQLR